MDFDLYRLTPHLIFGRERQKVALSFSLRARWGNHQTEYFARDRGKGRGLKEGGRGGERVEAPQPTLERPIRILGPQHPDLVSSCVSFLFLFVLCLSLAALPPPLHHPGAFVLHSCLDSTRDSFSCPLLLSILLYYLDPRSETG